VLTTTPRQIEWLLYFNRDNDIKGTRNIGALLKLLCPYFGLYVQSQNGNFEHAINILSSGFDFSNKLQLNWL
jgi:hypothetical protein